MTKPEQPDQPRHPGHSAEAGQPEQPEAWGGAAATSNCLILPPA
jgi:hypothetical protein